MTRVLSSLAAAFMAVLLAAGALAQTADDEWVATLLVARDELDKGIAQIDEEVATIPERIASDDWRVFPTKSGQVVELDLRTLEEHVPIAQVIAGHPEIKQVLLDAIEQADLGMFESLTAIALENDIDNLPPDAVMAAVRLLYTQSVDYKRDVYAAHQAKLKSERDVLKDLRDDIQRELDALARAAGASASPDASLDPSPLPSPIPSPDITPEPSLEPSAEPTPGMETDGVQYDAFEGLTACAEDDPECTEASPAPEPEPVPASSPCPDGDMWCQDPTDVDDQRDSGIVCTGAYSGALEAPYTTLSVAQIGACFDECQDWVSWHGSFGDTLPGWCSDESDTSLAMWDGQWPTNQGVLTLVAEGNQVRGEFDTDPGSKLAGAVLTFWPDGDAADGRLIGEWHQADGRYECAVEFGLDPGYWGGIYLNMNQSRGGFEGGFGYCGVEGGDWVRSE